MLTSLNVVIYIVDATVKVSDSERKKKTRHPRDIQTNSFTMKSNLEEPVSTFQHKFVPNSYTERSLPLELVLVIIQLLSRRDQETISLLSRSFRQLALPILFRKLRFSVDSQIGNINQVNRDIKAVIRSVCRLLAGFFMLMATNECREVFLVGCFSPSTEPILFEFLESLPNLQSFRWCRQPESLNHVPNHLSHLVASLQHCPLEQFEYWIPDGEVPCGPVTAPAGLKSLAGKMYAFKRIHSDSWLLLMLPSHIDILYNVVQPSFSTLVELQLRAYPSSGDTPHSRAASDLLSLRPVGRTLQKFFYRFYYFHSSVLDTIPDVFPNLTWLQLSFRKPYNLDPLWKVRNQTISFFKI